MKPKDNRPLRHKVMSDHWEDLEFTDENVDKGLADFSVIDLTYNNRRHWFKVFRFDYEEGFFAALKSDGIVNVEEDTIAYCDNYENGDECGRMYFLGDYISDPNTVSHEATHMALGIIARHGHKSIVATTGEEPELSHDLCKLIGAITGEILK